MKSSPTTAALAAALAAFNSAVQNPVADQTARVQTTKGTDYSYPYADLAGVTEAVRPALAGAGISVLQEIVERGNGDVGATTTLLHESGEWLRFAPVWVPGGETAQEVGGAISYSRRYGLLSALGLAAREPADGTAARRQKSAQSAAAKATPTGPPADREQFAELIRLTASRGKSMDGDVRRMANARGWSGPLPQMPASVLESISQTLGRLPVAVDATTGEVAATDRDETP